MSDAIEHADVMLYAVSLKYKESSNCRMELNYGVSAVATSASRRCVASPEC